MENSSLKPEGLGFVPKSEAKFLEGLGTFVHRRRRKQSLGSGKAPGDLSPPKLPPVPFSPGSLSLPVCVFFSFSDFSRFPVVSFPQCLHCLCLPLLSLCLCLSSHQSLSFPCISGSPPGFSPASLPASSFKHPEPPSVCDWLICKPLSQKLSQWDSDACIIASQRP